MSHAFVLTSSHAVQTCPLSSPLDDSLHSDFPRNFLDSTASRQLLRSGDRIKFCSHHLTETYNSSKCCQSPEPQGRTERPLISTISGNFRVPRQESWVPRSPSAVHTYSSFGTSICRCFKLTMMGEEWGPRRDPRMAWAHENWPRGR